MLSCCLFFFKSPDHIPVWVLCGWMQAVAYRGGGGGGGEVEPSQEGLIGLLQPVAHYLI